MIGVPIAGDVNEVCGALKPQQQVLGWKRYPCVADRITARVQNGAAEQVGVAESKAQSDAGASGESCNVNALGVDRMLLHDVLCGQQR